MQRAIIKADNVEVTYNRGKSNEFRALKSVNLEISPREYVILFGPSGCGKSTLLYSMFGVLPPASGKMIIKNDSIYDYDPMELVQFRRKTMGIVYQQFNLIQSITVLDNVALPLIFSGVSAAKREKRAMELLDRFGIAHVAHKRPTLLSGGQQQRVSVARSLVTDPEILIADEPVGNLDAVSSKAVMDTFEEINMRDKKTIVLVTHDIRHLPYAHRVVYLNYGDIERIVPNPEKRQIRKTRPGENIVTELEQLAHLFPYESPERLRVKSLANYLTQDLSFDQLVVLERSIQTVIQGRMSPQNFYANLVSPLSRGGGGLRKAPARAMTEKLFQLLDQSHYVTRFRRGGIHTIENMAADLSRAEIVETLKQYALNEHKVQASPQQLTNLSKSLSARVYGYIDKDEFIRQIMLPEGESGTGLDWYTANDITRYLEKLIAQGVSKYQHKLEKAPGTNTLHSEQAAKFADREKSLLGSLKAMVGL
jgi:putative ABC transport system ATP-binding protein